MALSDSEFNRAMELAVGRKQAGFSDVPTSSGKSWLEDAKQDFSEMGENTISDIQTRFQNMQDTWSQTSKTLTRQDPNSVTLPEAAVSTAAQGVGIGLDMLWNGVLGYGKMVAPESFEQATKQKVEDVMTAEVGDLGSVASNLQRYYEYKQTLPAAERTNLESAEVMVEGLLEATGLSGIAKTGKFTQGAVKTTVREAGDKFGATVEKVTPSSIRNKFRTAAPETREAAVDSLVDTYRKSFVDDQMAVNNKLDKLARVSSRGDDVYTSDRLLREMAEEAVIPKVDGRLAKFDDFYNEVKQKEATIGDAIEARLDRVQEGTSLGTLKSQAMEQLRNDPNVAPDIIRTERAIERVFESLERKYGQTLTPRQVNEVRMQMNRRTGSFNKEEFEADAEAMIGNATRDRIDTLVPSKSVREANAELSRLYRVRDTVDIFNNRQIDVGMVGSKIGSYLGVAAAAPIGFTAGGPGGLVVAGIAAQLGSNVVANILRKARFGNKEAIIKAIKQDPFAVKKLIDEAEGADKEILKRELLPAAGETSQSPDVIEVGSPTRSEGTPIERVASEEKIRQRIEERLNESYGSSVPEYLRNNKQAGFAAGDNPRSSQLQSFIKDQEKRLTNMEKNKRTDSKAYKDIQKEIGVARRMLDELEGKARAATPETTDLLSQAKGKTLDEFVESPQVLKHVSEASELKPDNRGVLYFTDSTEYANKYGRGSNKNTFFTEASSLKTLDGTTDEGRQLVRDFASKNNLDEAVAFDDFGNVHHSLLKKDAFVKYAKSQGYDAVKVSESYSDPDVFSVGVLNPDKLQIKTRSQLEDIWKKANSS